MASQVQIFNLSAKRLGIGQRIQDPNEASEPARNLRDVYDYCVDECLRTFPWAMARGAIALSLLVETFPGWQYAYQYPSDCVLALAVMPEQGMRMRLPWFDIWYQRPNPEILRVPWDRALRANGNSQMIITDLSEAWLAYVRRVTNPAVFDADFVNMLAWRLAMEAGGPLKVKVDFVKNAQNNYEAMRGRAAATDFNESYSDPEPDTPSLAVRY